MAPRQPQSAQSSNNGGSSSNPSQPAQQPFSNRDSVTFDGKTYTEDKDGNGTVDGWNAIFSDYAELGD